METGGAKENLTYQESSDTADHRKSTATGKTIQVCLYRFTRYSYFKGFVIVVFARLTFCHIDVLRCRFELPQGKRTWGWNRYFGLFNLFADLFNFLLWPSLMPPLPLLIRVASLFIAGLGSAT